MFFFLLGFVLIRNILHYLVFMFWLIFWWDCLLRKSANELNFMKASKKYPGQILPQNEKKQMRNLELYKENEAYLKTYLFLAFSWQLGIFKDLVFPKCQIL